MKQIYSKTTSRFDECFKLIFERGYDVQVLHYSKLIAQRTLKLFFLFVESVPPFRTRVVRLTEAQVEKAEQDWQRAVGHYRRGWAGNLAELAFKDDWRTE